MFHDPVLRNDHGTNGRAMGRRLCGMTRLRGAAIAGADALYAE